MKENKDTLTIIEFGENDVNQKINNRALDVIIEYWYRKGKGDQTYKELDEELKLAMDTLSGSFTILDILRKNMKYKKSQVISCNINPKNNEDYEWINSWIEVTKQEEDCDYIDSIIF